MISVMNLLIDENTPRSLASDLSVLGFIAQDARDIGLSGRPDEDILRTAAIKAKVTNLLTKRLPESLLGAVTFIEPQRALSQILRRRPRSFQE